jgi:Na+-translocating ferredoxin:NAD+ oxidoreductase subunit B
VNPCASLAELINEALPQTQCTRCGFPDCRRYAEAIAAGQAGINQCAPGGNEGVARLAALSGAPVVALNPANGSEGPLRRARIDESACIGCTLCLDACPVDCIVGGPKSMHTVIEPLCTGCELCLPACPVDCIFLTNASPARTGWQAWSPEQAQQARVRYEFHQFRLAREAIQKESALTANPRSASQASNSGRTIIDAARARARARRPA